MPRAVVFDLDETLLDRRAAWRYALEQAVAGVTGARVEAGQLADEYQSRPVSHAIAVVVESPADRAACYTRWHEIFYRSALKRLLVHEGVGMGLDRLRGARVEVGAISRERHADARHQVESTGIERFLAVLSATPAEGSWDPAARLTDCLGFLGYAPGDCAYVSATPADLVAAAEAGWRTFAASWVPCDDPLGCPPIFDARETIRALEQAWAAAPPSAPR